MAYYILNKGYKLRGWKMLPFGLMHPNPRYTDFFDKELYEVVYDLDGQHDIDEEQLSQRQKDMLHRMVQMGFAVPSDGTEYLEPEQEYRNFPGMYKSSVQWSITGRCNYHCRHCFMSAPDYKGEDLTLEESLRIVNQLADNGVYSVSITGGEPLVNPNFLAICDEMNRRGLILETLYSNGKLVDEKLLDELEKRHMHPAFHISFDGVRWHDWLRGEDGAETEAVRAFKLLKSRGYQITTSFCLHRHNIGDLRENLNYLGKLGLSHVKMNVITPSGRWKNQTEHFITMDEANEAILEYLPHYFEDGMPVPVQLCTFLEIGKEIGMHIPAQKFSGKEGGEKAYACGVVKNSFYISPKGKVLPCMTLGGTAIDAKFDSVLEKDLGEILADSYYRDMCLVKMNDCITRNEKCRDCKYRLACGAGCRAQGIGETGLDYYAVDEDCCQFFKNGWFEKAQAQMEKYKEYFPDQKPERESDSPETC